MAMAGRMKSSGIPLLKQIFRSSDALFSNSTLRPVLPELSRTLATSTGKKETKVKIPIPLFGGTGNYASALYIASKKANVVDSVEAEMLCLVDAAKNSRAFKQFASDASVPLNKRLNAINEICSAAKFPEVFKNFLLLLAENGRLKYLEDIAKKFSELTMADRGEVNVTVTTVIPLPEQEEKELKDALLEILGPGKKVKLQQKIDLSILGGIVVEFDQKVLDMSIKTKAREMERFLREPIDMGSF